MSFKMFDIRYFNKLDSTNTKAKLLLKDKVVIVANSQVKGRGRFKRKWSSGLGGLYFSVCLKVNKLDIIGYYTFIAALSVFNSVKDLLGVKAVIKWPNDLLFDGKKLCGILSESKLGKEKFIVVGIGVNTNNKIDSSLTKKAVTLSKIKNKKIDNKKLLKKILVYFEKYLKLIEGKKYKKIILDWKKNSFLGSEVKVETINGKYSGIAYDISSDLDLILKVNGKKVKIKEGDVLVER